ncbi:PI-PLC X domain-containing protein 1-like isoform X1 [Eucyclogobius newberryi]|uniref:PI-PLC X domain-containing protein 1-like isoform X1 n=1 Tax=Eucyclogobius newberryi TaxID=166745 RepID=UPI003B5C58AA
MEPGTEPDWMSRLPEPLLHVPLWELAIPGSHDSMSFCLDMSSPVLRSEPTLLRLLDCLLPCCTRPCIQRWSTTQRSVLSDQCDLGIRFLDLRIAKKPAGGAILFAHGVYTLTTVKEALEELCVWLESHPREVLILSCSHFECMTEQDHSHLVHFIIALFGPKLCPPQEQPSLSSCWLQRQQLIVSYDEEQTVREHPQLWTSIPYWYAESPEPQKVIQYLDKQLSEERPEKFFAAGLNLTEDLTFVLLHPGLTLRTLTLKGLPPLLRWTNQQRPGPRRGGVNIVCSDFIGLSQFCSIVIGLNYKLLDSLKRLNSSSRFAAVM